MLCLEVGADSIVADGRAAGGGFTLPVGAARHLLGTEPGGADLVDGSVPAADGPRLDVWALA